MDKSAVEQFLAYLERHQLREALKDSILEEIVAEGAKRGFLFSVEDLRKYFYNPTVPGLVSSEWQTLEGGDQ